MDCIEELVEKQYGIKVIELEKLKNIYIIHGEKEMFSLKKIKYEFSHFFFIISAMKHLERKKFHHILPFIATKEDMDYIKLEEGFGYMNPWINARVSNYDNPLEVDTIAEKLSELHIASQGFVVTQDMKPRVGWGKWIDTFNTRLDEIQDFKNRIERKNKKSIFDELYYEAIEKNKIIGKEAIEDLCKSQYLKLMNEEKKLGGFCHHDWAHHNILIDNYDGFHIIDFDYCILDTHLHDLSSFIIRVMKNDRWDLRKAVDIMNGYSVGYPLRKEEIPVMAAFMKFPQEFWQIGIQYYWERQGWQEEFFIKKLERILEDIGPRMEFLEQFQLLNYGG